MPDVTPTVEIASSLHQTTCGCEANTSTLSVAQSTAAWPCRYQGPVLTRTVSSSSTLLGVTGRLEWYVNNVQKKYRKLVRTTDLHSGRTM